MNYRITIALCIVAGFIQGCAHMPQNELGFDEDWKFNLGDTEGAGRML